MQHLKPVRQLLGVGREIGDGQRRVVAAIDPDRCQQRMLGVLFQSFTGQLRRAALARVDNARPAREAPGARAEEHALGKRRGKRARLLVLRRTRIGKFVLGAGDSNRDNWLVGFIGLRKRCFNDTTGLSRARTHRRQ